MKFGDNHTAYSVESGIPVPPARKRKTTKAPVNVRATLAYPLHCMKIGDSFFVPIEQATPGKGEYAKITNSVQRWVSKYPNYRFCLRRATKRGEAGLRVWRVAPRIGNQLA